MKLIFDGHTHTVASGHAYSTILENVEYAKKKGLKIIAITDHAHKMPGGAHPYHFWNLRNIPRKINGVIVLTGVEANILNSNGDLDTDIDRDYSYCEVKIASIHGGIYDGTTKEDNTNAYLNIIKNGKANIIGHPDDLRYDFDIDEVIKVASEYNVAIGINDASQRMGRSSKEREIEILEACKKYRTKIVCSSDAHIALDVGNFEKIMPILKEVNFPEELIVNTSKEKVLNFFKIEM
ncbi:MAG: phosphatase [Clostridiales bacterium]|nr:phosphatase [Clostridiales bacterium]